MTYPTIGRTIIAAATLSVSDILQNPITTVSSMRLMIPIPPWRLVGQARHVLQWHAANIDARLIFRKGVGAA